MRAGIRDPPYQVRGSTSAVYLQYEYEYSTYSMQVSLWMQRWQQRLSTWLYVSLSQQILRLYRPAGILSAGL